MGLRLSQLRTGPAGADPAMVDLGSVRYYAIPQRHPEQPFPVVRWPAPLAAAAYRAQGLVRRRNGSRLAYLDSHFPWRRSGFRYSEASAILEARPDTLFFSSYELTDPFPARVYPLADFPRIAVAAGITDVYAVFLLFLQGICGLGPFAREGSFHFMEGPDLWPVLRDRSMRVHGSIYPGGGLTLADHAFEAVAALSERLTTTFSYVPEVLERVPGVTEVPQAFTDTTFYRYSDGRWAETDRLVCLFAADAAPRKGLDAAIEAFQQLGPEFHLHVVGPHEERRDELPPDRATFHGWLQPEGLRRLHAQAHVFVSPVRAEPPGPPGTFQGIADGFPTQAAADAVSSGCLLVSSNPLADHRVLTPGVHYVECGPDGTAIREALRAVAADGVAGEAVARAGAEQVRRRMDVRHGTLVKLQGMGLAPPSGA